MISFRFICCLNSEAVGTKRTQAPLFSPIFSGNQPATRLLVGKAEAGTEDKSHRFAAARSVVAVSDAPPEAKAACQYVHIHIHTRRGAAAILRQPPVSVSKKSFRPAEAVFRTLKKFEKLVD